jgi:hypothetical protein
LNGKVERTHRADREEFWDRIDAKDPEIKAKLSEWQHHWNWHRPHTALGGMSPIDRVCELLDKTPLGKPLRRPTTAAASASGLPIAGWTLLWLS